MKITSLQNTFVKSLFSLKLKKNRDDQQLFLLDDRDLIESAHQAGVLTMVLYSDESFLPRPLVNIELHEVSEEIIAKLSDVKSHCGLIGVCRYFEIKKDNYQRIIALDGVQDPGNGGTIVRSADAFAFDLVFISQHSFDDYNPKFIRATKGSIFHIPCQRGDIYEKILSFKQKGFQVIVTDLNKESIQLQRLNVKPPYVLVVGSEGQGISESIQTLADIRVMIPMNEGVESLNVGVASSLCMYELTKK